MTPRWVATRWVGGAIFAALLTTTWPDGRIITFPATTLDSCQEAAREWVAGRSLPLYFRDHKLGPPSSATCTLTDPASAGFPQGWDCIQGFNCERSKHP